MDSQYKNFTYSTCSDTGTVSRSSRQSVASMSCGLGRYKPYLDMYRPMVGSPIRPVVVNTSLLDPLHLELDPTLHDVKVQEKEQIKSLNNRFASVIDKVRHLEQQNKMLETKWQLLQGETQAASDMEPAIMATIANLQAQLHGLSREKEHWDLELQRAVLLMEENKQRYEDEITRRTSGENDFVLLKQETDTSYLTKTSLMSKVAGLENEVHFLMSVHEQELQELNEELQDTHVVVQMDNCRDLNMERIVAEVKSQYEEMAAHSRQEVEEWYKTKLKLVSSKAEENNFDLRKHENEITMLNRHITRLQSDISSVKAQCESINKQIAEDELHGKEEEDKALRQIKMLKEKLQQAKQKMVEQVSTYQELMNVKMALDIEIATYGTLLKEEENRIEHGHNIFVQAVQKPCQAMTDKPSPKIYIKTTEIRDSILCTNEE